MRSLVELVNALYANEELDHSDGLVPTCSLVEHLSRVLRGDGDGDSAGDGGASPTPTPCDCDPVLLLAALVLLAGGRVRLVRRLQPASIAPPTAASAANADRTGSGGSSSSAQKRQKRSSLGASSASNSASSSTSTSTTEPALWLEVYSYERQSQRWQWQPIVPVLSSPADSKSKAKGKADVSQSQMAAVRLMHLEPLEDSDSGSEWTVARFTPSAALYALAAEPRCCSIGMSAGGSSSMAIAPTSSTSSSATAESASNSNRWREELLLEGVRLSDRTAFYFPAALLDHRVLELYTTGATLMEMQKLVDNDNT